MQGIAQINWKDQKLLEGHGKYYYPSVDCGMINIDKAKKQFGWKPTKLRDAVKDTYEFFKDAETYSKELKIAKKKFMKVDKYYPNVTN